MVTRKSLITKEKDKKLIEVPPGRKPPSIDLSSLENAFNDGTWNVPIGEEIIVERRLDGKRQKSLCIVKKIDDSGVVHVWDETLDRWFLFDPPSLEKNGILVKKINK